MDLVLDDLANPIWFYGVEYDPHDVSSRSQEIISSLAFICLGRIVPPYRYKHGFWADWRSDFRQLEASAWPQASCDSARVPGYRVLYMRDVALLVEALRIGLLCVAAMPAGSIPVREHSNDGRPI